MPIRAKAGYMAGYNDPEFIAALPKVNLPNLPKGKSYRMFPIIGDSMAPIPEGSDVIASFVDRGLDADKAKGGLYRDPQWYVFKMVTVQGDRTVLLESLNKAYQPYSVAVNDVLEVWQFHSYHTKELPAPETGLDEIKRMISNLKESILK
ncbi:helix-turn-helix transcriptional regulator [Pedobacter sp. BG31]|uniref:S24 family peptidase n=1 Tax=Pedobacter sp. BG31 TaxID=3349697 RepID=UPI0035F2C5DB